MKNQKTVNKESMNYQETVNRESKIINKESIESQ